MGLEAEIKKAAKMGNKDACKILAKQLVQLRNQKTRTYAAGAKMSSIQSQAKMMHTNQKMAQSMAKTMQNFEKENMKMEMTEEMMNDAMESAFAESGDEEEADNIMNQVLDEIG